MYSSMQLNFQAWENQMMTQFQEVMSLFKQANSTQNTATSDNKNSERKPGKSKRNNNKSSPQPHKYCSTHGACAHTSLECNHKADLPWWSNLCEYVASPLPYKYLKA